MAISRRNLLKWTGASALGGSPVLGAFNDYFRPAAPSAAVQQELITACGICSPACGMTATVTDGVLTFLKGAEGDMHGEGHLCGKGAAGSGFLYDPDRLKYPMKRTNPKKGFDEDPGWVRITWQEALDTIATGAKLLTAS